MKRSAVGVFLIFILFSIMTGRSFAATITVTNLNDSGSGSLRDAIATATSGDIIEFSITGTIVLTGGELLINKDLIINGTGQPTLIIDGNNTSRVFHVLSGNNVTFSDLTIQNGNAGSFAGGGILNYGTLSLNNITVAGNSARIGGGIYDDSPNATVNINSSLITGNVSVLDGGGLYTVGANNNITIDNSTISNNTCGESGGGIYSDASGQIIALNNTTLSGNIAYYDGGGFYNGQSDVIFNNVSISNNLFSTTTSLVRGGGIYNQLGDVTINNSSIFDHRIEGSNADGGGIYHSRGTMIVNNSHIYNNTSVSTASSFTGGNDGGGIYNSYGILTLNDTRVTGNTVTGIGFVSGGGIYNSSGSTTLNNTTVSNNRSDSPYPSDGGGVYNSSGTVEIFNSTISGNIVETSSNSTAEGGGIYNLSGSILAENSIISFNSAISVTGTARGGGIYSLSGSTTLNNSTLSNNSSTHASGGIYNAGSLELNNSTISANQAVDDGGGIYNRRNLILNNSTVSDNSAGTDGGGGIYNTSSVTLNNSIVANSPSGGDYVLNAIGPPSLILTGFNIVGDGSITGANVINSNPVLGVLADNGGGTPTHALQPGSPAIDAADNGSCPVADQRGAARGVDSDGIINSPQAGDCDIGAYEANAFVPQITITIDNHVIQEIGGQAVATVTVVLRNYGGRIIDLGFNFYGTADDSDYTITGITDLSFTADGSQNFTITAIDDAVIENVESIILQPLLVGSANLMDAYPQTINIQDTAILTNNTTQNIVSSQISVFDPAISKIGLLLPGQTGVTGEQIEWVVTVSNTGNVAGSNVTITDTLIDALRVDSVSAPGANVSINGQTVSVTYPTLNAGQTVQFSIFTTVLDGVEVNNTACVMADNQSTEKCATGAVIASLPQTGESPFWRNALILLAISGSGILLMLSGIVFNRAKRQI